MKFKYTNLPALHDNDDRRIAVHESGHAIFGARNGCLFDSVEIGPNEHGEVAWTNSPLDNREEEYDLDSLQLWQTLYAAGAGAEHIVFGEIRRHAIRRDMICHLQIDMMRRSGIVDLFESAIERAAISLEEATIKCVAQELTNKNRLEYEVVCELIGIRPVWDRKN